MNALSILNELNMPDTLKVVGRIPGEDVLNYVNEIRKLGTNDLVYFDFTPVSDSDQKEYSSVLNRMQQNKEFTVIEAFSKSVKDFYITAYEDSSSDGCNNLVFYSLKGSLFYKVIFFPYAVLNGNSTSGLLRGIVVRCNKKRTVTQAGIDHPAAPHKVTKLDSTWQKNALVGSKRSSRCVFLYKCVPASQKNSTVEREELNETQLYSSAEENYSGTGMVASMEKGSFGSVSTNLFPEVTLPSLFPGPSQPIKRTVLRRTAQTNIFKIQDRLREFHIPVAQETKSQSATSTSRFITPVIEAKPPKSHGSKSPQPNLSHTDGVTRLTRIRRYEEEQKLQVPLNRNHEIEIAKEKVSPKLTERKLPITNRIMSVVRKVPEVERGKEVHARNQKNPHRSVVTKKKEKTMKNETRQEKVKLSSRRSDDLFKEKDRKRKFVKENGNIGASSIPKPTKENTRTLVENGKTLKVQTIENPPHRSQVSNKDQRAILGIVKTTISLLQK